MCRGAAEAPWSFPVCPSPVAIRGFTPFQIGRLREVDAFCDRQGSFHPADERVAALRRVDGWSANVGRRHRTHAPERHTLALHVHILTFETGVLPRLGHDVVLRIVAPPRAVIQGTRRQLRSDHAFDLVEGHPDDWT